MEIAKTGGRVINDIKFADDAAITAKTQEELQEMVNRLVDAGRKYGMKIKIDKLQVMNCCLLNLATDTFKYHVSCTDRKISVRIIYFYYRYLFFHCRPIHCCVLFHPTRLVENVALRTKGLHERKHNSE